MLGERPETKDEWRDFYLAKEEHEAIEVIDGARVGGPQLTGARMAQQVREDQRRGDAMTAAFVSNQIGLKALRRSNLGLILSVLAIAVTIGIAVWQHYCK